MATAVASHCSLTKISRPDLAQRIKLLLVLPIIEVPMLSGSIKRAAIAVSSRVHAARISPYQNGHSSGLGPELQLRSSERISSGALSSSETTRVCVPPGERIEGALIAGWVDHPGCSRER